MNTSGQGVGRTNQKQRTRSAILHAAGDLLREGKTPTIPEVAEAAGVSRATAYRYFPTQDLLLIESTLDAIVPDVHALLNAPGLETDVEARLDALVVRIQQMVTEHEGAFRTLLRLSQDTPDHLPSTPLGPHPRRGGRRIGWIADVLEPGADQLDPVTMRRLSGSLSLFLGIETRIVLRDICALPDDEAEDIARWAARALLRTALAESGARTA